MHLRGWVIVNNHSFILLIYLKFKSDYFKNAVSSSMISKIMHFRLFVTNLLLPLSALLSESRLRNVISNVSSSNISRILSSKFSITLSGLISVLYPSWTISIWNDSFSVSSPSFLVSVFREEFCFSGTSSR